MPRRHNQRTQQAVAEGKNELRGLNQNPSQLVELVLKAYEEGINAGRNSLTNNEKVNTMTISAKKGDVNQKKVRTEEEDNNNNKNFKRKWMNDKYEPGSSQPKKKKVSACDKCGKKHMGVCLRGRGMCYNCQQNGHVAPQCPKPRKGGCFQCGAYDHQVKECPKKKKVVTESSDLNRQVNTK